MKFAVKLSIVVAVGVFVIGVYRVSTTKAEVAGTTAQELSVSIRNDQGMPAAPVAEVALAHKPEQPAVEAQPAPAAVAGVPVHVSIPAAAISAPVIPVGLTAGGDMDVPSGSTNNVGWWQGGTLPGDTGSAVLDAHVFAALKNLHNVQVGNDIYIDTAAGSRLHFKVEEATYYALADVPDDRMFNRADTARLNLITCAGTYVPSMGTYDHRLVVYAVLVP